ncbi:hypothetical protein yc1106_00057 [Curvularia clavata]|uniref:Uncharacterized protein n=1 Tax=Curvularia clavata TaxID=95742 RepID=A0A9Q8Z2I7_CURCL|nr:hypothetical protein yc1106_00057 [Curvularia clavata]
MMLSWWPETQLEWAFFAAAAAQGVINTTIQMIILVVYFQWINPQIYEVPLAFVISLTLSINTLGCLYQMTLTLDAYRIKNHLQIFALCITNVCLSASTVLQYHTVNDAQARAVTNWNQYHIPLAKPDWPFWRRVSPGLIVCAVVSCLCSIFMCGIAPKLYREFAWALYQDVSPDTKVQRKYMFYQIYLVFLKYTPYFVLAFLLVYSLIDVHYAEPEFSLTMCIIPAILLHLALAVYCVRNEKRIAMSIILLLHAAFIAYAVSRLMVLYGHTILSRTLMKDEMVFYLSLALASSVFSLVVGFICMLNFGKGLKPILLGQIKRQPRAHELEDDYYIQRLNYNILSQPSRESQRFTLD